MLKFVAFYSRYVLPALAALTLFDVEAVAQSNIIPQNTPLRENVVLHSANNLYWARLQSDGNFVIVRGTGPDHAGPLLWAHNKNHPDTRCPCVAVVQPDGNFVISFGTSMADRHDVIWADNQNHKGDVGPFVGILQDDGTFAVYHGSSFNNRGGLEWSTQTSDPLQGFENVSTLQYDLSKAHITAIQSQTLAATNVQNDTDSAQSSSVSLSGTVTEQSSWSDTITNMISVQSESGFNIPVIGVDEKITLQYQHSDAQTNGGSTQSSVTWTFNSPVNLAPHTSGQVSEIVSVGSLSVPYAVTGTAVYKSGDRVPVNLTGLYTGVNSYDGKIVITDVGQPANGASTQSIIIARGTPQFGPTRSIQWSSVSSN